MLIQTSSRQLDKVKSLLLFFFSQLLHLGRTVSGLLLSVCLLLFDFISVFGKRGSKHIEEFIKGMPGGAWTERPVPEVKNRA